MSADDEVLLARAYLSRVSEPASVAVWALVDDLGPVEAMRQVMAGTAPRLVLSETGARRNHVDPETDLAAAERHRIRLVIPESDEWPHFALASLERTVQPLARVYRKEGTVARNESGHPVPPLALWVRGSADLTTLGVRSAGVVGARAATAYGEHVTSELAYGLTRHDVTVVSGGAHGIDATAHRAALAADGPTVIVSAGGLDRPYPPGNATLFDRAAATGLLISESPPGCAPQRRRFLTRNRLIASFATGVVVVEAASRSGAMNTAGHARLLGRPLMAVPGPVTSALSAGCHRLLRWDTGPAILVTSVDDVLAVVGASGEGLTEPAATEPAPPDACRPDVRRELDGLDPLARQVFDGLSARRFARPDEVATRSGVSPLDVVRALPALELADLVESSGGRYRIAARLRPRVAS